MFDIEADEIRTSLDLSAAADLIRALIPDASVKEMRGCILFELPDGNRNWAVVSVFADSPTLVEARYVAGTADPRCAKLRADLVRTFEATVVLPTPPPVLRFQERLLERLRGIRESGIRIRYLAFGPPASPEQIAEVERAHLGFPMPAAMRTFFEAHDGLSLLFHRVDDLSAEIFDHSVPLTIENEGPIAWNEAMHDGGPIWALIDAADFGESPNGGFFYAGMICIPNLATLFSTDWASIMGWPEGTWLFDSFHPFYSSALVADRASETVWIQPTADYGADRDAPRVDLAEYLENLLQTGGTERIVAGHRVAVRSHG